LFEGSVPLQNLQRTIDKAERYFAKGKYQQAFDSYESMREYASSDPKIYLRLGDIGRKLGNYTSAIEDYKAATKAYARQGFIVKAIAVCKVILNLDPAQKDIENNLAALYLQKDRPQSEIEAEAKAKAKGGMSHIPEIPERLRPKAVETPQESEESILIEIVDEETAEASQAKEDETGLARTPLFSYLGPEELTEVIKKLKARSFSIGEFVFKRGDEDNSIYVITSGAAEVISRTKYDEQIKSATLTEGDFFGEQGYFSGLKRGSDILAITALELLEISKDDMDLLAAEYPGIHKVLYDFYKERVLDKVLAISKVFKHLSVGDRKELLEGAHVESFPKGTAVIRDNEKGENMYVIISGEAEVWKTDESGKRKPLITLYDNDYFGEAALVLNRPRVSNVTAISTCLDLIVIGRKELEKVLKKYPMVKSVLEDVASRHVEKSQA
jgi:CRP-like cAMP-binding protein